MDGMESAPPAAEKTSVALPTILASLSALEQTLGRGLTLALTEEHTTIDQWRVLELVDILPAPTMGELSAASSLSNASLSRAVDTLEDNASVYRIVDTADRRRIAVHLSDYGADRLNRIRRIVNAWEAELRRSLGDQPLDTLAAALEAVLAPLTHRPR